MAGLMFRQQQLVTLALASASTPVTRLPNQYLWSHLVFTLFGAVTAGGGPALALDGELNLIQAFQFLINGRTLKNLSGPESFYKWTFLASTQGRRTALTTGGGQYYASWMIALSLPAPATRTGNGLAQHITAVPAALVASPSLQTNLPTSLIGAVYSTPGSSTMDSATLQVDAMAADVSIGALRAMMAKSPSPAYIENSYNQNISGTGDQDQQLSTGSGFLWDIYERFINNGVAIVTTAAPFISNIKLQRGSSDYPYDSTFLAGQGSAQSFYNVDQTSYPVGTFMECFSKTGRWDAGVPLASQMTLINKPTVATAVTLPASQRVITGVTIPGWMRDAVMASPTA